MKLCPVCGKTYAEGLYCEDCGLMLIDAQPAPVNTPAPPVNTPAPPVNMPEPPVTDYDFSQPIGNPPKQSTGKNNTTKIVIIVLAVLLVTAIAVAAVFAVRSIRTKNTDTQVDNDNFVYAEATDSPADVQEEEIIPAETTAAETTTQLLVNKLTEKEAYETFNKFYVSYLYAINDLDASYMNYCSPKVRNDMAERFEINKKSLFDLKRIDFDQNSLVVNEYYDGTEFIFYVKCVTMLYDRTTHNEKDLNFSCWKVTVSCINDVCQVTDMERDSDYKMGTDIYMISDDESLF